jgi:hypothetical protein
MEIVIRSEPDYFHIVVEVSGEFSTTYLRAKMHELERIAEEEFGSSYYCVILSDACTGLYGSQEDMWRAAALLRQIKQKLQKKKGEILHVTGNLTISVKLWENFLNIVDNGDLRVEGKIRPCETFNIAQQWVFRLKGYTTA